MSIRQKNCNAESTSNSAVERVVMKAQMVLNCFRKPVEYTCHRRGRNGHFRKDCRIKRLSNIAICNI